jgi:hypothetical protein
MMKMMKTGSIISGEPSPHCDDILSTKSVDLECKSFGESRNAEDNRVTKMRVLNGQFYYKNNTLRDCENGTDSSKKVNSFEGHIQKAKKICLRTETNVMLSGSEILK